MLQTSSVVLILVMWLQVPPADKPAIDGITVTPISVSETRYRSMTQGSMAGGTDKPQDRTLSLSKPLDDTMTLKVKLVVGQKMVKVPFELKDIELPRGPRAEVGATTPAPRCPAPVAPRSSGHSRC